MRIERPRRKLEAVGLTPLIDMIFLLLLFFLLGSDFVRFTQSQLAPPRGTGGEQGVSQPAIIALAATGALQWNGASISRVDMQSRATDLLQADAEQLFVVMPAAAAEVQQVVGVMDDLAAAGAQAVTLERDVFDIDLSDF
ncbi:MAG: biopolymer transporter ExbD [PS1 clade bacterium]|nr:biopolymer transporter ExbD [PS1 clade bacterium]CAI8405730.1 MAG: Uncharacterised protein [Rhodobiaceae bacterium UBA7378]